MERSLVAPASSETDRSHDDERSHRRGGQEPASLVHGGSLSCDVRLNDAGGGGNDEAKRNPHSLLFPGGATNQP